jgi:poly-gamma-glutamate capsule biosynthesis protein CapA/YwtB (metallophosphatase superfamily)
MTPKTKQVDARNILSINAVGDICPGDKTILGLGVCSLTKKNGCDFSFKKIEGLLDIADIAIGNLEGLLSHVVKKTKSPTLTFCGLPSFARELKAVGFNVLNVANNHTLEHGHELFNETIDHLSEAGIKVCGLRDTGTFYSKPVYIETKGKTVGILGYNWVGKDKFPQADNFIAQSHDSVVNYTWERDKDEDKLLQGRVHQKNVNVRQDIGNLKREVDFVILAAHWGYEFVHYPPYGVICEAHSFVDAGADLIIGGHPHVIQGMEQYKGKWIFYSLGNFLFDMRSDKTKKTTVLHCNIEKDNHVDWKMTHIKINKYFQPSLATDEQSKEIQAIIDESKMIIMSDKNHVLLNDDKIYEKFEKYYNKGKFLNILYHFLLLPANPSIIKIIFRKLMNFLALMKCRMHGERVRW